MKKVRHVMTHSPQVISPDASLIEAADKMRKENVGTLIVAKGAPHALHPDDLLGIVSDRDIVVRAIADGRDPEITSVSQAMTTPIFFCREGDNLETAVQEMENKQIRRLAVITSETNQLSGMVSLDDIAEAARTELAGEVLRQVSRKKAA